LDQAEEVAAAIRVEIEIETQSWYQSDSSRHWFWFSL